jgi:hypothetical protein
MGFSYYLIFYHLHSFYLLTMPFLDPYFAFALFWLGSNSLTAVFTVFSICVDHVCSCNEWWTLAMYVFLLCYVLNMFSPCSCFTYLLTTMCVLSMLLACSSCIYFLMCFWHVVPCHYCALTMLFLCARCVMFEQCMLLLCSYLLWSCYLLTVINGNALSFLLTKLRCTSQLLT